jgi:hypothetical protein
MARLEEIISQVGWPGISMVGAEANGAAFLVLQHAHIKFQKKYLPLLQEAAKTGEVVAADLALLEDRVLMRDGKNQIYGSQLIINSETGQPELWPIDDEANVDKRRAAVGLEPLKDYMARFGLEYVPPDMGDTASGEK